MVTTSPIALSSHFGHCLFPKNFDYNLQVSPHTNKYPLPRPHFSALSRSLRYSGGKPTRLAGGLEYTMRTLPGPHTSRVHHHALCGSSLLRELGWEITPAWWNRTMYPCPVSHVVR